MRRVNSESRQGWAGENGREGARCGFKPLEGAGAGRKPCLAPYKARTVTNACASLKPEPEAKGFDWTTVWRKQAYALYGKSM